MFKLSLVNKTCLVFLLVALCGACHTYYKAVPAGISDPEKAAASIDSLQKQNRYFILRNGNTAYNIKNPVISADKKSLNCELDILPADHHLHLAKGIKGKMQYKKASLQGLQVLNEVHFYTGYDTAARQGSYSLPLDRVQKIEIIQHDRKRTTNSYVIGAVGYTLGAAALVLIIVAATKSSCPFVSAYDGTEFSLQGEIFGGSIYPQLARHDYMPLKMLPRPDGTLQLKIINELQERQYTDMADLWVVTHDNKERILTDEQGNLYAIADPQPPIGAELNSIDVLPALKKAGDYELLHLDDSSRKDARNDVILRFKRPADVSAGKLLLTLKNSYWLDLLYGELAKGFGTQYASYIKDQRSKPPAELLRWVKEQQIPLEVSIRTRTGWQKITDITTVGPLANRDMVVPIALTGADEQIIEIKLSAGFMFWEIDYAAIDFTTANSFTLQKLAPFAATDEKSKNVLAMLKQEDGIYLEQPEIGNSATLSYKANKNIDPTKTQTYILHARGYYEHIRDFKNKPDLNFLARFRQPNAFPVYGMHLYKQVRKESLQSLAGAH